MARRWLLRADRQEIRAVTSELTLAEVLPHPIAKANEVLAQGYRRLLVSRSQLGVMPISRKIVLLAAELRGRSHIKLADAIHAETAMLAECEPFLTEGERLAAPGPLGKVGLREASAGP